jgi:hypothetical protein
MGKDLLHDRSPNELEKEIKQLICGDQRSLPPKSKVFAAVAKLQEFDGLPEVVKKEEMDTATAGGALELNRGLGATKGVPAIVYARALVAGAMYPGTWSALGNGMYFAVPSLKIPEYESILPMVSAVALKYTKGEEAAGSGFIVRAALKKGSKIVDCDQLKEDVKLYRNRAKKAGITDIGAFAAALGIDAFYADGVYDDTEERVYTVLNRGALLVQGVGVSVRAS